MNGYGSAITSCYNFCAASDLDLSRFVLMSKIREWVNIILVEL